MEEAEEEPENAEPTRQKEQETRYMPLQDKRNNQEKETPNEATEKKERKTGKIQHIKTGTRENKEKNRRWEERIHGLARQAKTTETNAGE